MSSGKRVLASPGVSALADAIRGAIGAGPEDTVMVTLPQFTRDPTEPGPKAAPRDRAGFDALRDLGEDALQALRLRRWGRRDENRDGTETGPMLWLFPGEWYPYLPAGLPVVDIFWKEETFAPGATDDDIRFGCLSFGIVRNADLVQ
jgi:hypothetical protein